MQPRSTPTRPVTGAVQPKSGPVLPVTGAVEPRTTPTRPFTGPVQPKAGPVQPRTGVVQPDSGVVQPRTTPTLPINRPVQPSTGPVRPVTGAVVPPSRQPQIDGPTGESDKPKIRPLPPSPSRPTVTGERAPIVVTKRGDTGTSSDTTERPTAPSRGGIQNADEPTTDRRSRPVVGSKTDSVTPSRPTTGPTRSPNTGFEKSDTPATSRERVAPGSRAPGSRPADDPLNTDRINKKVADITRIPEKVGPKDSRKVALPFSENETRKRDGNRVDPGHDRDGGDHQGDRDRGGDHSGDRDRHGDGDRDWRDRHDSHRNYGCDRRDHSHCSHSWWTWDVSWGDCWSHRTLYRYHWFAGSHFHDYYGYGLWISFHGSRYYCPWYHTDTIVYYSPRYVGHVYYGVDRDSNGDAAVDSLEQGWAALEYGDWTTARRLFARASSLAPQWGLPRIGYALACAASGNTQSAERLMVQAFQRDPYSALEIPWSDPIVSVITDLEAYYSDRARTGYQESENWFMAATLRLMLNDPDGASDAAFAAEASGNTSDALQGLLDVLAAQQWDEGA